MTPEKAYKQVETAARHAVRGLKIGKLSLVRDWWVAMCKKHGVIVMAEAAELWVRESKEHIAGMRVPIWEFKKQAERWIAKLPPIEEMKADPVAKRKSFFIPISNGIFEHTIEISTALWLFLWYIDKTTDEESLEDGDKLGYVLGGKPVKDQDIADELEFPRTTICDWRNRLSEFGYIEQTITPYGTVVRVKKSKKWLNPSVKNQQSEPVNRLTVTANRQRETESRQTEPVNRLTVPVKAQTKKTIAVDSTETTQLVKAETRGAIESLWRKRYPKEQFLFWKGDEQSLALLSQSYSQEQVLAAYRFYIEENYDPWVIENRSPFGYFAKRFHSMLELVESAEKDHETAEDEFVGEDVVLVVMAKGGLTRTANRETAKQWLAHGHITEIRELKVQ